MPQERNKPQKILEADFSKGSEFHLERGSRIQRGKQKMVWDTGILQLVGKENLQDARKSIPFEIPGLFRMPGMQGVETQGRITLLEMAFSQLARALCPSG